MEIISHRGYWLAPHERNAEVAFHRSFDLGMGTETDLRDHCGEIVISHDMADGSAMTLADLLRIMNGRNLTLALNIKADGLGEAAAALLRDYDHTNYFMFDMSIPDMVRQLRIGNTVFTGLSDILPVPVLPERCQGIWLDAFESDWYDSATLDGLLEAVARVCIVSADLHKRDTRQQWEQIRTSKFLKSDRLLLCTDKPLEAQSFFNT